MSKEFKNIVTTIFWVGIAALISQSELTTPPVVNTLSVSSSPEQGPYGMSESTARKILENMNPSVMLGMTPYEVKNNSSWGEPRKVTRTTSASGTSEIWFYKRGALWFNNGRVSSIVLDKN